MFLNLQLEKEVKNLISIISGDEVFVYLLYFFVRKLEINIQISK